MAHAVRTLVMRGLKRTSQGVTIAVVVVVGEWTNPAGEQPLCSGGRCIVKAHWKPIVILTPLTI